MSIKKCFRRMLVAITCLGVLSTAQAQTETKSSLCTGTQECGQLAGVMGALAVGSLLVAGPHYLSKNSRWGSPTRVNLGMGTQKLAFLDGEMRTYFGESLWALDSSVGLEIYQKNHPAVLSMGLGIGGKIEASRYFSFYPTLKLAAEKIETIKDAHAGVEAGTEVLYRHTDRLGFGGGASVRHTEQTTWKAALALHQFQYQAIYSLGYIQNEFLGTRVFFASIGMGF